MNTVRYYRTMDIISESDILDTSESHIINCVGVDNPQETFRTIRQFGRKDNSMIYVTNGSIDYVSESGEITTLKPGMGIFLHNNLRQEYFSSTKTTSFYWIHFTGKQALETLARFNFSHEFVFDIGYNEIIVQLFHKIFREFTARKFDYIYSSSLHLLQIFVEIKRSMSVTKLPKRNLEKSLSFIHDNYLTDIAIEQLAKIENMSISHYRSLFSDLMNTSPKQYITSLRISYAANLLQFSEKSIKEIAEECGYNDLGYFYRMFKKSTNMTPLQCRDLRK